MAIIINPDLQSTYSTVQPYKFVCFGKFNVIFQTFILSVYKREV